MLMWAGTRAPGLLSLQQVYIHAGIYMQTLSHILQVCLDLYQIQGLCPTTSREKNPVHTLLVSTCYTYVQHYVTCMVAGLARIMHDAHRVHLDDSLDFQL